MERVFMDQYAVRAMSDGTLAGVSSAVGLGAEWGPGGLRASHLGDFDSDVSIRLLAWGRDEVEPANARGPQLGACYLDGSRDAFGSCLRRVEYRRRGLIEWWENHPEGLEQGFSLAARPRGAGPLRFELGVEGATVKVVAGGHSATLQVPVGQLHYRKLAAWDATGRALQVWMEPGAGGLAVVVDDAGASYPLMIDPLLSTASWSEYGASNGDNLGRAVVGVGDLDRDGYDEVVIAAPLFDLPGGTDSGRIYVFKGSSSGISAVSEFAWSCESASCAGGNLGFSVDRVGDVDGDSYPDFVVGCPYCEGPEGRLGQVWTFFGDSDLTTMSMTAFQSDLVAPGVAQAKVVAGIGDFIAAQRPCVAWTAPDPGATPMAQVVVACPDEDGDWVEVGKVEGWLDDEGEAIVPTYVARAGDMDEDGVDDLLVGASNAYDDDGAVFVVLGPPSAGEMDWDQQLRGAVGSQERFGYRVAGVGDLDGDGHTDVVVGAKGYSGTATNEGAAYAFRGNGSGLDSMPAWMEVGCDVSASDHSNCGSSAFGAALSAAGDVNGDGFADLIVGQYLWDVDGVGSYDKRGRAMVYLGGDDGLGDEPVAILPGDYDDARMGHVVNSAGDPNGDGWSDVLVGAYNRKSGRGGAYAFDGAPSHTLDVHPVNAVWARTGGQGSARGGRVEAVGDLNGDGFDDVVVGDPGWDQGGLIDAGRIRLYCGTEQGLPQQPTSVFYGEAAHDNLGDQIAALWDLDADGFSDFAVTAPGRSSAGYDGAGEVYVFVGQSRDGQSRACDAPLAALLVQTLTPCPQLACGVGMTLSSAGDYDGDGHGDLAVGTPRFLDGIGPDQGRVALYRGGDAGFFYGGFLHGLLQLSGDRFGASLDFGDLNGDQYSDLVVGEPGFLSGRGAVNVFLGGTGGLQYDSQAWGAAVPDALGTSVAVMDFTGDGYSDIAAAAPGASSYHGALYGYVGHGSGSFFPLPPFGGQWTIADVGEGDRISNFSVANAGDVNGDGFGDFAVGVDVGTGFVRVYLGATSTATTAPSPVTQNTEGGYSSHEFFGESLSAGDVNGDGYSDLLVGDSGFDEDMPLVVDAGKVVLLPGNGNDLTGSAYGVAPMLEDYGTDRRVAPLGMTDGVASQCRQFHFSFNPRSPFGPVAVGLQSQLRGAGYLSADPFVAGLMVPDDAYPFLYAASPGSSREVTGDADPLEVLEGARFGWRVRLVFPSYHSLPQDHGPWLYGGAPGDARGRHFGTCF